MTLLGLLSSTNGPPRDGDRPVARFIPTAGFRPRCVPGRRSLHTWDCRHGRVLLADVGGAAAEPKDLLVWDPATGSQRELKPRHPKVGGRVAAAVLCAVPGCDHHGASRSCQQDGPFRVVLVGTDSKKSVARARVYSSETGKWSAPASDFGLPDFEFAIDPMPSVLAGDALHFLLVGFFSCIGILKYDLGKHCLSEIKPPAAAATYSRDTVLMAAEDGNLGLAYLDSLSFSISLWSAAEVSGGADDGVVEWTRRRVFDLRVFLPMGNYLPVILLGSVEGTDVVFANTDHGIYEFDLKSLRSRKHAIFPYMSFHGDQPAVAGPSVQDDTNAEDLEKAVAGLRVTQN